MSKSENLINELISAKIITNRLCDRRKAQLIIRDTLCQVHREAVESTIIAKNKREFIYPQFND
jgi:hypothetical protein